MCKLKTPFPDKDRFSCDMDAWNHSSPKAAYPGMQLLTPHTDCNPRPRHNMLGSLPATCTDGSDVFHFQQNRTSPSDSPATISACNAIMEVQGSKAMTARPAARCQRIGPRHAAQAFWSTMAGTPALRCPICVRCARTGVTVCKGVTGRNFNNF